MGANVDFGRLGLTRTRNIHPFESWQTPTGSCISFITDIDGYIVEAWEERWPDLWEWINDPGAPLSFEAIDGFLYIKAFPLKE
jgi:hypothetical protein